jgi:two-component system, cell cycle response regulator
MTVPVPQRRGEERTLGTTILVVDDSRTIRRILRRDLEAAGYAVLEAADGEEALKACHESTPDVVLLDVDMPRLDGMATLERMQADPGLRQLPVLFLTARTGGEEAARGLDLGAHDYLKKPCDAAELLARVGAVLRRRAREKRQASQAVELAALSTTDPLTAVPNRRGLEMLVAGLTPQQRIGVLLIDLDHFKRVNDTAGHLVGDAVLTVVAARLRAGCGTSSHLARWGGEEFVVVAPDSGAEQVAVLAEGLRSGVGSTPLQVGTSRPLPVTTSIGTAVGTAAAFTELLQAADTALYIAKEAGRDRVVAAPGASPTGCGSS